MAHHFRIATRVPPGAALKRVALSELAAAIADLGSSVHGARKHCKKLRALLRLLRQPLGDVYAPLSMAIRDAARAIAGRRRLEALTRLCADLEVGLRGYSPAQRSLLLRIQRDLRGHRQQHVGSGARARKLLRAAAQQLRQWQSPVLAPATLEEALTRSYRAARQQRARIGDKRRPEHLHEWRKRTKIHHDQCVLLSPLWPQLGGERARQLDRLAKALGDHQDLHELELLLNDPDNGYADAPARVTLQAWILRRQKALTADALAIGDALFDARPREWKALLAPRAAAALA